MALYLLSATNALPPSPGLTGLTLLTLLTIRSIRSIRSTRSCRPGSFAVREGRAAPEPAFRGAALAHGLAALRALAPVLIRPAILVVLDAVIHEQSTSLTLWFSVRIEWRAYLCFPIPRHVGRLGCLLRGARIPLAPFVIGFVLAPVAEENLSAGLQISAGSYLPLVTRPVSLAFLVVSMVLVLRPAFKRRRVDSST